MMVDEIHLLNEEYRGATLEAIIARMMIMSQCESLKQEKIRDLRIIVVSATIGNINSLAEWLNTSQAFIKQFDSSYKTSSITKVVYGY
jgi:ATP-dependent DNA helicase HFM1/MER3